MPIMSLGRAAPSRRTAATRFRTALATTAPPAPMPALTSPPRRTTSTRWRLLTLALTLTLAGCAAGPARDDAPPPHLAAELAQADALAARGEPRAAAELYLKLAASAPPAARSGVQIKAVRADLDGRDFRRARATLAAIQRGGLADVRRDEIRLAEAELALLDNQPGAVRAHLAPIRRETLPPDLRLRHLGLLAAAERLDNRPLAAAQALSERDTLLTDERDRLLNQVSLLATLNLLPARELQRLSQQDRGTMRGWAELALLAREASADAMRFESSHRAWRARAGTHPALPNLGRGYADLLQGAYSGNDRVAILLPRAGRFQDAATAVRQGIEAASRTNRGGARPELRFIDSDQPDRTLAQQAEAAARGATAVIGPLQKPSVDNLAAARTLAAPTLALNETAATGVTPRALFQFALSPENEAAELASKAAALRYRRALLLHPADTWGERLGGALRGRWRHLGGTLAGQASFDPGASNHDATVDRLVEGVAADVIFLIATPEQARRIHPRIRLVAARAIPVIATSHVHDGNFDPTRDRALVGLYFVDIPWMLESGNSGGLAPPPMGTAARRGDPLERLRAMGIDAWRLTPHLERLARLPGAVFPGHTGLLSLDPLGRVQRQLVLASFTETGPRTLGFFPSRRTSATATPAASR